jgi:hypothetical protein
MESPDFDDVCSSLRQRLDEVRFHTRRAAAAITQKSEAQPDAVDDPRFARVELYNTVLQTMLMGEVAAERSKTSASDPPCQTSRELPFLQSSTQDIGTADLCDSSTLFQTLVVKTAEWLMSRGAVYWTSQKEKDSPSNANKKQVE